MGIAPPFDEQSDVSGTAVVRHLALNLYGDLSKSGVARPVLLAPGGMYSAEDTSWLLDTVRDRQDLDLLLVTALKASAKGGGLVVKTALLDAHTGSVVAEWTANSDATTKKGMMTALGASLLAQGRASNEAFGITPLGMAVGRVSRSIRDTVVEKSTTLRKGPGAQAPAPGPQAKGCVVHTRITYSYRHAVSRSHTLLVNDLDETTTVLDGVSSFQLGEGPFVLQFALNDAPYSMSKQALYQVSAEHLCGQDTLVIDIGKQGDAHLHWE